MALRTGRTLVTCCLLAAGCTANQRDLVRADSGTDASQAGSGGHSGGSGGTRADSGGARSSGGRINNSGAGGASGGLGGATTTGGTAGSASGGASGGTATGGTLGSGGSSGGTGGTPVPGDGGSAQFQVFLLIGQSNMEGIPPPEAQDTATDPRVKVLAYDNCTALNRKYNEWYPASPPLHSCDAGVGPGDYFAKTYIASRPGVTVGLVPNAIKGVDISFFRKGVVSGARSMFRIPPDDHWSGAYDWVIDRAKLAQKSGPIRGILFHQGESDSGNNNAAWVDQVTEVVKDLRADLGLGNDVPFIAGELLYGGCCSGWNTKVQELPGKIPNSAFVSADGLTGLDQYHFNLVSQRELGKRYGQKALQLLP